MKPTSYATRTLVPFEPLHGSATRHARLWALGGALVAIPNLLVLRFWSMLSGGLGEWRSFLVQQESAANLIAHGGYVLVAIWGGIAALRTLRRIRRARRRLRSVPFTGSGLLILTASAILGSALGIWPGGGS